MPKLPNTDNPNSGKRRVRGAFRAKAGGRSSECISRMPDGKVYLFNPRATRKSQTRAVVQPVKMPETARIRLDPSVFH